MEQKLERIEQTRIDIRNRIAQKYINYLTI